MARSISIGELKQLPIDSYQQRRAKLRSGDLLFASGNYPVSKAIRKMTGSPWSHVGIIVWLKSINRVLLLESVEMRHAPFALWLTNLTDKDPFFVLPVLMGISMFIQQKLNPAPVDPMQQKIFQIMPFAFTIMFAFFPSGLVLYWVVNNILSITQQYVITKRIENS